MHVSAVFETTTGKQNGEVSITVGICVAHSTAKERHRAVQQTCTVRFFYILKFFEKSRKLIDMKIFNNGKFINGILNLSMMRKGMVSLGNSE